MTRVKDEDIPYSLCNNPVGAWIGAIEMNEKRVLLIGSMDLSGRVEITGDQIRGFYEDDHDGKWLVGVGSENEVFECYKVKLGQKYGLRTGGPPCVWCSWYGLFNTINEPVINKLIVDLDEFPFDVIQIDDGWQIGLGE
jgi:alpha-galactosidase